MSFQPTTSRQTEQATPKSHIPAIGNIELGNHDEETLIAEVQSLPSDKLNWSELARKYNVRLVDSESELKNGGQVIKELLRNKGIDVDRFGEKTERVRRTRKEGPGGKISIPTTSTIAELNNEIKIRIENGTYNIGELIAPKKFKTIVK